MTVIYIDSVFALNTLMDYLLLLSAARLAGLPLRRKRYVLGALLGGAYAVAVFLPGFSFLAEPPVKLAAGILLGLAAYGGEEKLFRLILLFFVVSCAMAGCVLGLGLLAGGSVPVVNGVFYTNVDAKALLIAGAAAYFVLSIVFRTAAGHGVKGELLPVRLSVEGRVAELTALWDNGNGLRAADGRPVLVLALGALDGVLPSGAVRLLTPAALRSPEQLLESLRAIAPELRPRLTPYHAVGTAAGLLLTIHTDWMEINGTRYSGLTAALSPEALGVGYAALWGGGKGGKHGCITKTATTVDSAGYPAGGGDSLHWRQRHSSAPTGPRAGGGASGKPERGGKTGADRA